MMPPQHSSMPRKRDENETAFDTLQEILRPDAERDGEPVPPKHQPEKWPSELKPGARAGKSGGRKGALSYLKKKN
jgi:hypothetical protein